MDEGVPRSVPIAEGAKILKHVWVDTNKGDNVNPNIRSRICARELTKGRNALPTLDSVRLFSAMPPLEALKLLCSLMMSLDKTLGLKLAHFDISRAHFAPEALRIIFIELLDEDKVPGKDEVGLLNKAMYGTQDASNLFQKSYTGLFLGNGLRCGKASPATFYGEKKGCRMLVHGDDFITICKSKYYRLHRRTFEE